jgi:cell wall-associated NlpC family hydrolase
MRIRFLKPRHLGTGAVLLLAGALGLASPSLSPADGGRRKSPEELRLEYLIEAAYRQCFRTYWIAGRSLTLRLPFAQNEERQGSPDYAQSIFLGGKGSPDQVWAQVDALLDSELFDEYIWALQQPGEKVIEFDLELGSYAVYFDPILAEQLAQGSYPGTGTLVYVLKSDSEITEVEVYNYLYCLGFLGLDCSGFVYYIQKSIAAAYACDLDEELAQTWGTAAARVPEVVGLWLFDPGSGYAEQVEDTIESLRPGDILLFLGREHTYRHSAVIQSIDTIGGRIRYLQCTDWAPQRERGVHASQILFDPGEPALRLSHSSVRWLQQVRPTFVGEPGLEYWRNDGDRFRAYLREGGSLVVRLRLIRELLESVEPGFYACYDRAGEVIGCNPTGYDVRPALPDSPEVGVPLPGLRRPRWPSSTFTPAARIIDPRPRPDCSSTTASSMPSSGSRTATSGP